MEQRFTASGGVRNKKAFGIVRKPTRKIQLSPDGRWVS